MKLTALVKKEELNMILMGRIWMVPEHLRCHSHCLQVFISLCTRFNFGIFRNGKCHVQWQSVIDYTLA